MRRIFALLLAACLIFLCGCSVYVDYGSSELYSRADIDAAVLEVRMAFARMEGCRLISLQYAGDDTCRKNLEYAQGLAKDRDIRECLVFNSVFLSPVHGGGAWEPASRYTWTWTLGRSPGGRWILLTYGYA